MFGGKGPKLLDTACEMDKFVLLWLMYIIGRQGEKRHCLLQWMERTGLVTKDNKKGRKV